MKCIRSAIAFSAVFTATLFFTSSTFVAAQDEANPLREKFQEDLKAAVMSESITVTQLKEIQANIAVLKEAKGEEKPGAPVDLVTPYTAVSKIKAIMATVKEPARTTLRQDFQLMMATKQPAPSTEPCPSGKEAWQRHLRRRHARRTDHRASARTPGQPQFSTVDQDRRRRHASAVQGVEDC